MRLFLSCPRAFLGIIIAFAALSAQGAPRSVLVYAPDFDAQAAPLASTLATIFSQAGYTVATVDATGLAESGRLDPAVVDLLVLPDASRMPLDALEPVQAYLKGGGDLVALNTPAFREVMVKLHDKWVSTENFRAAYAKSIQKEPIIDFSQEDMAAWSKAVRTPEFAGEYIVTPDGPETGEAALSVNIKKLDGWDSRLKTFETSPFQKNHVLTLFSARNTGSATHLGVEWEEQDGSRWIATVPLYNEWHDYLLAPADFKYWESVPSRESTQFNPGQARRFGFTMAFTHTGYADRNLCYMVGPVGTGALTREAVQGMRDFTVPRLEMLSPGYKFFPTTDVAAFAGQGFCSGLAFSQAPGEYRAMHPRPRAAGFGKGRSWVWEPLLAAMAPDGQLRGAVASMLAHVDGPYKGGIWVSVAVADLSWYTSPEGAAFLARIAGRLKNPVVMLDGGANHYTYFEDQSATLGATVCNLSREPASVALTVNVQDASGASAHAGRSELVVQPGESGVFQETWRPENWLESGYTVSASAALGDAAVGQTSHEMQVWRPKQEKHFVTAEAGDFLLDGKRWLAHGVNYMPSSGIASEDGLYFERWLSAQSYDPGVIQRDLERCRALGLNALSIFIYRENMEDQNLLDFLRRMDALGMKANLSLRPGTPMDFPWQIVRELIEYYRLADNDTVFAYDLAWEPQFRPSERDPFNSAWEAWLVERYGSLENVEKNWGFPVPRDAGGKVINFNETMIGKEGPWSPMVAAYRRFLDTLLYEKYSAARRLVRGVDPNHHVSFRMSMASDPTNTETNSMVYDFSYLGGAVDLFEPEGYGRIGDWDRVKPGWFTYEYARWANPALPVLWGEAGVHVWDTAAMTAPEDKLAYQAGFYEDYYKMMMGAGFDGVFWWWYPGGFRANENSDYGIINPDGTFRPVSEVIRKNAAAFLNQPVVRPVDTALLFDRDQYTNGLTGVYKELEASFWGAQLMGNVPGLHTEATGTDSATCPLTAVGNRPGAGQNPPKYLDAFIDEVYTENAGGQKTVLGKGNAFVLSADKEQVLHVAVTNLGEAALLNEADAGGRPGAVYLTVNGAVTRQITLPRSLPRFQSAVLELRLPATVTGPIELGFLAKNRSTFGPRFPLVLAGAASER